MNTRLIHCQATVDRRIYACHKAAVIASKEGNDVRDLLRLRYAPQRCHCCQALSVLSGYHSTELGFYHAWGDHVGGDAGVPMLIAPFMLGAFASPLAM